MDNQHIYGSKLLKVLSYIDDKINPESYNKYTRDVQNITDNNVQIGGTYPTLYIESQDATTIVAIVNIDDKTTIQFTIKKKDLEKEDLEEEKLEDEYLEDLEDEDLEQDLEEEFVFGDNINDTFIEDLINLTEQMPLNPNDSNDVNNICTFFKNKLTSNSKKYKGTSYDVDYSYLKTKSNDSYYYDFKRSLTKIISALATRDDENECTYGGYKRGVNFLEFLRN